MRADRVQKIKDNLARIGVQDTKKVLAVNRATARMEALGLTSMQVIEMCVKEPEHSVDVPFHGFDNRAQAMLAGLSAIRRVDRPGYLQDAHDRVNTMLKNQQPERAATTLGLALVSIPMMTALPEQAVKRMRRLPSGKLKEINAIVDVEEVVESNKMMKPKEPAA